MKADIYNAQGKKSGSVELPEDVFNVAWNESLMHQAVTIMEANARTPVAHTKNRGDVRGGGKKPWQQKGTGRARHGSIRSPIWRGGGVTHGPRAEKIYARQLPKKMRAKALFMALSQKMRDGHIIFIDSFGIDAPKTALAKKALVNLSSVAGASSLVVKAKNAALVAMADPSVAAVKSFRNISNVSCRSVRELNPRAVLGSTFLLIENPEAAVSILSHRANVLPKKDAPKKVSRSRKQSLAVGKGDQ